MNRLLYAACFAVGLLAIGWVGAGYVQTNPLALAITGLIAAFYLMGALELRRFHQATAALERALHGLAEPPASLGNWLGPLPAALQTAVRLRIEGERIALPGPALTPYLVGLLVLLGMLGTFLGMVVTLSGTSVALESATDLQTMRDSLAAPVKGLGLAFGTSVAGVAASALLGLMSALCRRERLQVAQRLDALHRRPPCAPSAAPTSARQSLRLQQQQAAAAGRRWSSSCARRWPSCRRRPSRPNAQLARQPAERFQQPGRSGLPGAGRVGRTGRSSTA